MEFLALSYTFLLWALIQILVLGRKRLNIKAKLPPGPIQFPIVGSLFKLGKIPHESLTQLAKIHGPLMTVKLGQLLTITVSSSTMAKQVLQHESFSDRHVFDALRVDQVSESSVVWSPPNARWRKLRAVCKTQMFTTARLAANEDLRQKKVEELIAHLHEHCQAGRAVDVGQAAFTTILNLIWNTVFSSDLVDLNSEAAQEVKDIVLAIMVDGRRWNVVDYFPVLRPFDPQGIRRRFISHANKLNAILYQMIDQRLSSSASTPSTSPGRNDFLDVLLHQTDEDGCKLSRDDIKQIIADLFVPGTDTSSAAIEWAMVELLRNPSAMQKAQLELKQIIGNSGQELLRESDIARLPYLQAIVKETLRLHPPVPMFNRKTLDNVEISGFMIPKNTPVVINMWAIGRDPDVWSDASAFLPERFLDSKVNFKGLDFELIPFGSGRRICLGLPLADRMIHLILASLLRSFTWKLPDGMTPQDMDISTKFGPTLHISKPLRAIPTHYAHYA